MEQESGVIEKKWEDIPPEGVSEGEWKIINALKITENDWSRFSGEQQLNILSWAKVGEGIIAQCLIKAEKVLFNLKEGPIFCINKKCSPCLLQKEIHCNNGSIMQLIESGMIKIPEDQKDQKTLNKKSKIKFSKKGDTLN